MDTGKGMEKKGVSEAEGGEEYREGDDTPLVVIGIAEEDHSYFDVGIKNYQ